MLKAIIVTINIFALVFLKFFFGGDVSVEQDFPSQVNQGENFVIEVSINKGDREGFAKWQQSLPAGFIASVKDAKGATFSFKNQEVKLIWMALPSDEKIVISYTIEIDPNLNGTFELDGKFSFIEENERKDIFSSKRSIIVGASSSDMVSNKLISSEDETVENTDLEEQETAEISNELPEESNSKDDNSELTEVLAQKDSSSNDSELITDDENISVYRNVSHIENGEYLVSLKVEKGTFKSFGKIEEYIPEGFIASEGENQNGQFSFRNNVVKILWMTLPEENTLEVTYNLKSETDLLESVRVHGMFSYLNADQSEQIEMQASTFKNYYINESLPNEPIVEEAEISSSTDDSITSENEVIDIPEEIESNGEDALKEEIASDESENSNQLINDITNIPSPETSVTYKVQLAAGKKEVDQKYFVKVHNISEQVSIEYHESWYKYTIGKFDIYKQARDKRNEIWNKDNKINDAFVTAYNSGERITVQEALMISNQKWFK